MNTSLGINVGLIVLGLVFVVVGALSLLNDVVAGSIGGVGGILLVIGGTVALRRRSGQKT
ncbi:hypothetical protein [Microbacterium enclense]|uniref:hypothetical protein n=1 Tax=Microbacterium enclense TaxID=993073 RepID=UPI003419CE72